MSSLDLSADFSKLFPSRPADGSWPSSEPAVFTGALRLGASCLGLTFARTDSSSVDLAVSRPNAGAIKKIVDDLILRRTAYSFEPHAIIGPSVAIDWPPEFAGFIRAAWRSFGIRDDVASLCFEIKDAGPLRLLLHRDCVKSLSAIIGCLNSTVLQ